MAARFFRIRNESEARKEIEFCDSMIKGMADRYRQQVDVSYTFLQIVATKYMEEWNDCPKYYQTGDKALYRFIASYNEDAKKLAKLWQRKTVAVAWLKSKGINL